MIATVILLTSAIGAKDCGLHFGEAVEPPGWARKTPDKPFCMVDPPAECVAFCVDVDAIDFTDNCLAPGSDVLTAQFMENVREAVELRVSGGEHVCDDPDMEYGVIAVVAGQVVTPCDIGIIPRVLPTESLDACTPPPSWC